MSNLQKFDDEQRKIINDILKKNNEPKNIIFDKNYKEIISITFKCSKSFRPFNVLFGRENYDLKYQILKTLRDTESMGDLNISSPIVENSSINLDIDLFNFSYFNCPYCESNNFCQCSCQKLICMGAVEIKDNKQYIVCPCCGTKTIIEGHIQKLTASKQSKLTNAISQGKEFKEIGPPKNYKSLPE